MSARAWVCVLLLCVLSDGAWSWYEEDYRERSTGRYRRVLNPRWDSQPHDPVPQYDYQEHSMTSAPKLRPRARVLDGTKGYSARMWDFHRPGTPRPISSKRYRATITSTVTDGKPRRRERKKNRNRKKWASRLEHRKASREAPLHPKVCARCPSDRAVLAKKGTDRVIMDPPPVIPCYPWSSVEKVKAKIVSGPRVGAEVTEGSHKVVIQLLRHRRVITTCVTRYTVIVRKCPEVEVGPGVRTHCPRGQVWGAHCNVSCDLGYDLDGDPDTECTDDLEWTGVMPQCIPSTSCPVPISPDHGHLSCRTPRHHPVKTKDMLSDGSVCHYQCDLGYAVPPAQQHLTKIRCVAGSWDSDQDPTCVEINETDEEEDTYELSAAEALKFDEHDCPEDFCRNGGHCIVILNQPQCSCKPGYSGPTCEHQQEVEHVV